MGQGKNRNKRKGGKHGKSKTGNRASAEEKIETGKDIQRVLRDLIDVVLSMDYSEQNLVPIMKRLDRMKPLLKTKAGANTFINFVGPQDAMAHEAGGCNWLCYVLEEIDSEAATGGPEFLYAVLLKLLELLVLMLASKAVTPSEMMRRRTPELGLSALLKTLTVMASDHASLAYCPHLDSNRDDNDDDDSDDCDDGMYHFNENEMESSFRQALWTNALAHQELNLLDHLVQDYDICCEFVRHGLLEDEGALQSQFTMQMLNLLNPEDSIEPVETHDLRLALRTLEVLRSILKHQEAGLDISALLHPNWVRVLGKFVEVSSEELSNFQRKEVNSVQTPGTGIADLEDAARFRNWLAEATGHACMIIHAIAKSSEQGRKRLEDEEIIVASLVDALHLRDWHLPRFHAALALTQCGPMMRDQAVEYHVYNVCLSQLISLPCNVKSLKGDTLHAAPALIVNALGVLWWLMGSCTAAAKMRQEAVCVEVLKVLSRRKHGAVFEDALLKPMCKALLTGGDVPPLAEDMRAAIGRSISASVVVTDDVFTAMMDVKRMSRSSTGCDEGWALVPIPVPFNHKCQLTSLQVGGCDAVSKIQTRRFFMPMLRQLGL